MPNVKSLANQVRRAQKSVNPVIAEALEVLNTELINLRADLEAATSTEAVEEALSQLSSSSFSQGIYFDSVLVEITDPNDFGLRFLSIKCTYFSNLENLQKVEVWAEDPVDGDAVSLGVFNHTPAGIIYVPYTSPATAHNIRIYLVPVSTTIHYQLHTVGEYGTANASPNKTVEIYPIPTTDLGTEYAGVVTGLSVTDPNESTGEGYFYDANGVYRAKIEVTFTAPSDLRFAGVEVIAKKPGPVWESLGRFESSPTGDIQIACPPTLQTYKIFAVSFDKFGRRNSIIESTPPGTLTPSQDITVGDTAGKLDIAKALASSLGPALEVAANVLGVATGGITEDLIGTFAVSKLKLKNAPIIDAVRIEDLAVGTGHIQLLAILTGLIQNAAIINAKIGTSEIYGAIIANAGIDSAKINTLVVDKVTGWGGASISLSSDLTFTGSGAFVISSSGGLLLSGGGILLYSTYGISLAGGNVTLTSGSLYITGGVLDIGTGGMSCDGAALFTSSVSVAGLVVTGGGNVAIQGTGVLSIGGSTAITNGRNGFFVDLQATGNVAVTGDIGTSTGDINATIGVYKVGGTQVVGARGSAVSAASESHACTDFSEVNSALDAMGQIVNAIRSRMQTHGLIST